MEEKCPVCRDAKIVSYNSSDGKTSTLGNCYAYGDGDGKSIAPPEINQALLEDDDARQPD